MVVGWPQEVEGVGKLYPGGTSSSRGTPEKVISEKNQRSLFSLTFPVRNLSNKGIECFIFSAHPERGVWEHKMATASGTSCCCVYSAKCDTTYSQVEHLEAKNE